MQGLCLRRGDRENVGFMRTNEMVSIWYIIQLDTFWVGRSFWMIGVAAGLPELADDGAWLGLVVGPE
jgi:hypothetical protein